MCLLNVQVNTPTREAGFITEARKFAFLLSRTLFCFIECLSAQLCDFFFPRSSLQTSQNNGTSFRFQEPHTRDS